MFEGHVRLTLPAILRTLFELCRTLANRTVPNRPAAVAVVVGRPVLARRAS